jgi:hypothetical protein
VSFVVTPQLARSSEELSGAVGEEVELTTVNVRISTISYHIRALFLEPEYAIHPPRGFFEVRENERKVEAHTSPSFILTCSHRTPCRFPPPPNRAFFFFCVCFSLVCFKCVRYQHH